MLVIKGKGKMGYLIRRIMNSLPMNVDYKVRDVKNSIIMT